MSKLKFNEKFFVKKFTWPTLEGWWWLPLWIFAIAWWSEGKDTILLWDLSVAISWEFSIPWLNPNWFYEIELLKVFMKEITFWRAGSWILGRRLLFSKCEGGESSGSWMLPWDLNLFIRREDIFVWFSGCANDESVSWFKLNLAPEFWPPGTEIFTTRKTSKIYLG